MGNNEATNAVKRIEGFLLRVAEGRCSERIFVVVRLRGDLCCKPTSQGGSRDFQA